MEEVCCATGRRKTSVARIIIKKGKGEVIVNGEKLDDYMKRAALSLVSRQALVLTGYGDKIDVSANVYGGGLASQAGAIRHGVSRALMLLDSSLRPKLKKAGYLTRDPRVKERKKYGQRGARAKFQFSKR